MGRPQYGGHLISGLPEIKRFNMRKSDKSDLRWFETALRASSP
jgi:hypothetical protein